MRRPTPSLAARALAAHALGALGALALLTPWARAGAQPYHVRPLPEVPGGLFGPSAGPAPDGTLAGTVSLFGGGQYLARTGPAASPPYTPLAAPGFSGPWIGGVAAGGLATGQGSAGGHGQALYWDAAGALHPLGWRSTAYAGYYSQGVGVTGDGRVLAMSTAATGHARAYVTAPNGGPLSAATPLPTLPGYENVGLNAGAINDAGRVVGSVPHPGSIYARASYWDAAAGGYAGPVLVAGTGEASHLGYLSSAGSAAGWDGKWETSINAIFWSGVAGASATFLPHLQELSAPSWTRHFAFTRGVNASNQVVGTEYARTSGGSYSSEIAFLWDAAAGTRSLGSLVTGWLVEAVQGIDDAGRILARVAPAAGSGNSYSGWAVLDPSAPPPTAVPEPATVALTAAGLAALARARRRRGGAGR